MSEYHLSERLTQLSVSARWDEAKLEWELEDVWHEYEPDTCLCGHTPINEICQLRNKLNGNKAIVGNHCVKKFTELPSDKIFQAVKRVNENDCKALNPEAINHAKSKGWISDWEYNFYLDTWRKRSLSQKQSNTRIRINHKVLQKIVDAR
ncbi:MAG TPA: hypothetical protein VJ505_03740 [Holophagaceae bacterium]|nr:hypothetical protein [Holophagaceae bacterium]